IGVTGAKDANGNAQQPYTAQPEFSIDTLNPSVVSVDASDGTATPTLITDADTRGGKTFSVTVVFNQAMTADGSADPTLTFTPSLASSLTSSSRAWIPDHKTYAATYNFSVSLHDTLPISIGVTGAKDANGNAQQPYTAQPEFSIDTLNPSVVSVDASDGT